MKRTVFAIISFFALAMGYAQLQHVLPSSVRLFMDERANYERRQKINPHGDESAFKPMFAQPEVIDGVEMVNAFIDIDNVTAIPVLRNYGVRVNCEFDGFVTAQVPVSQLSKLTNIPGVANVEISRVVDLCTDSTLLATHAGQVLNGPDYGLPQAYDGSGVIIGVIDEGFDYRHLAFRCANDTSRTRIARVYDQLNDTGHRVKVGNSYLPGSVFMGEQLDTMTYDTHSAHGTHTTSIAAGINVGGYSGMAPGADIVLCSVRNLQLIVDEVKVINAIKYIYSYADSVGKPCVISLSISTNQGSHDGLDRISQAVNQLTGPGRIFVIAAGNGGNRNWYVHGPVTKQKPLNMCFCFDAPKLYTDRTFFYKSMWFDTWVRAPRTRLLVRFHIFDKFTKRIAWESAMESPYLRVDASEISQYYAPDPETDSVGYLTSVISQSSNNKFELQCYIYNLKCKNYYIDQTGLINSRYQIGVTLYAPSLKYTTQPDSCYIDSWICSGARGSYYDVVYVDKVTESGDTITEAVQNFYSNPVDYCSINTYAVGDSTISAGAYVARTTYYSLNQDQMMGDPNASVGGLYFVSAYEYPDRGPTGKHLPTVMAPGFDVISAGSRYSYFNWGNADLVMRTPEGYLWGAMSGTSMAAPTVAGIIAEWLQIEPTLSPGQIKDIISRTAIKDNAFYDPSYGLRFGPNGKIDAMAGVQYLLSLHEDDIIPGDVNDDGVVSIKDLTILISYLLTNGDYQEINIPNADLNEDGFITIKDVTKLILMLLQSGEPVESGEEPE